MKDNAGRDAQVILILRAVTEFVEAGQEIVELHGAERETVRDADIHAAAKGHRKRIVRSGEGQAVAAADVRYTEKNLTERRKVRTAAIRNTRTEQICGERAVHAGAENVAAVITAEIGDAAEPAVGVVGDRSAAPVEIETVQAGSAGIGADVRISGEDIDLGRILRGKGDAEE